VAEDAAAAPDTCPRADDPDIVLMDEPFGALDALTRERMQKKLLEIWRAIDKTIVSIIHSVDKAVFLGSRVMVMSPCPGRMGARRGRQVLTGRRAGIDATKIGVPPRTQGSGEQVRPAIHQETAGPSSTAAAS
jgi:translation initiation factor RLI1